MTLASLLAGAGLGSVRLRAIDAGALHGTKNAETEVTGYVAAVPRRSNGEVRVELDTPGGRVLAQAPEPVADLSPGIEVSAEGRLQPAPPWLAPNLRRHGIAMVLETDDIEPTGGRRGGLAGRLDAIRNRAADALGRGMPAREAALARGFVLGQDDSIDPVTVEDFRRSGLAHLLAVSGQNVLLLALLAAPLLGCLGIPLRARLLCLLCLIAIYVPLAGGGPSIQRAGVMGAAAVLATLAGRPSSRLYALLAAAAVTLALNPRASGDPGWQLSFAAVLGIFLLSRPLREALCHRFGTGPFAAALSEGAAVTIAATVATAPLIATTFGTFSASSVLANLLVAPAVAPAMWLGMIVAALGQVPHFPVEPLNGLNALLLAFIAQVAAWLGRPGWASAQVALGAGGLLASYAGVIAAGVLALRHAARVRSTRPASGRTRQRPRRKAALAALLVLGVALVLLSRSLHPPAFGPAPGHLLITVLDVGQGDAILLQPAGADAVLVDAGPPGDGIAADLRGSGVRRLGALVVTHDEADHAGGVPEVLGALPVHRLVYGFAGEQLLSGARDAGAGIERVGEGSELRSGGLRLEVLWPPRVLLGTPVGDERNARAIVLLARFHRFRMLLTADAEAEAVPIEAGPVDVLKVAHHGSDDAGLGELLDREAPALAVISVGEGNTYGHPTGATLATLDAHDVPVMRTDEDGSVEIDVGPGGFTAEGDG